MPTLARRFTIITLSMAIFAMGFSMAVSHSGGSGAQSHFGANYACASMNGAMCYSAP